MTPGNFKIEVKNWADEIGVTIREIHIRNMKNKWASCSSKGRLTFDPSVIEFPRKKRILAVLHELLHLRYPNHGSMFTRMLKAYMRRV